MQKKLSSVSDLLIHAHNVKFSKEYQEIYNEINQYFDNNEFSKIIKKMKILKVITQERLDFAIKMDDKSEIKKFGKIISDLSVKIKDFEYKIQDSKYYTQYKTLNKFIEQKRVEKDLKEVDKTLKKLKDLTVKRLEIAEKYDNKEDLEKYNKLIKELRRNLLFNKYYLQYKEFESIYNNLIELTNRNQLTDANAIFTRMYHTLDQYIQNLEIECQKDQNHFYNPLTEYQKFTQKDPKKKQSNQNLKIENQKNSNLSYLYQQSSNLTDLYKNLEETIVNKFALLIEDGSSDPIILESIKSDIILPEIISLSGTDEIPEFVSYLDSLFNEWGSNKEKK